MTVEPKIIAGRITSPDVSRFGKMDDRYRTIRLNPETHALVGITYEHHEIHTGSHYFQDDTVDLANGEYYDMRITTPNTTSWAHMVFSFETETEYNIYFYEGSTINTAGTAYTIFNNDRNSTKTSGLAFDGILNTSEALANADTTPGTPLFHVHTGSKSIRSGTLNRDDEIILKQNTIYTTRFHCVSAGYVNWKFTWYEHTNKD